MPKYTQVIHRQCGGAIIFVANKKGGQLACDKCNTGWEGEPMIVWKDMELFNPKK